MAKKTGKIAAGRNVKSRAASKTKRKSPKTSSRKSNSRDRAMKMGDLRNATDKSPARFSRKKTKMSEISHDVTPLMPDTSDSAEMSRTNATRNKLTARVASLRR